MWPCCMSQSYALAFTFTLTAMQEALMPLCRRGLTNIDWFIFNGIELVEADLDYLSK